MNQRRGLQAQKQSFMEPFLKEICIHIAMVVFLLAIAPEYKFCPFNPPLKLSIFTIDAKYAYN
jgi:hypothetical protein